MYLFTISPAVIDENFILKFEDQIVQIFKKTYTFHFQLVLKWNFNYHFYSDLQTAIECQLILAMLMFIATTMLCVGVITKKARLMYSWFWMSPIIFLILLAIGAKSRWDKVFRFYSVKIDRYFCKYSNNAEKISRLNNSINIQYFQRLSYYWSSSCITCYGQCFLNTTLIWRRISVSPVLILLNPKQFTQTEGWYTL